MQCKMRQEGAVDLQQSSDQASQWVIGPMAGAGCAWCAVKDFLRTPQEGDLCLSPAILVKKEPKNELITAKLRKIARFSANSMVF